MINANQITSAPTEITSIDYEKKHGITIKLDKCLYLDIEKVIYNDPATIILWNDGTKTVVTCAYGDVYDKQRGFLLCCAKKLFGNSGKFNSVMSKHCPFESYENRLLEYLITSTRGI